MEKIKTRLQRINKPAKASLYYTMASIISKGALLAFTPVFTRILSPDEYGIYSLYSSWMGIFTVIETLEISGNLFYAGLGKDEDKDSYLLSSITLQCIMSSVFLILSFLFKDGISSLTKLSYNLLVSLTFQIFLNSIISQKLSYMRYFYDYKRVFIINSLMGVLTPLISLFLILFSKLGGYSRIASPLIVSTVISLPIFLSLFKNGRGKVTRGRVLSVFVSAFPLFLHYISLSVVAQGDKIIISHLFGRGDVARYSVAYSCGFMLSLVTTALGGALSPWIRRKTASGDTSKISEVTESLFFLFSSVTVMFFCFLPELFYFLAGEEFAESIFSVYPIAISVLLLFLINRNSSIMLFSGGRFKISLQSSVSAALSVILNYMFIKNFGYKAAGVSTFLSYFVMLLLGYLLLSKEIKRIFLREKNIFIMILVLILCASLLYLLRGVFISRFLIFLAALLLLLPKIKSYGSIIFDNG